jgi:alpha-beta hydrolase superfamily lysophospholipase
MKKVVFKNSRSLSLVGNFYSSDSKSIVIISHALANDKSERGKLDAIAEKLNFSGFGILAFDFSGCGESDDDTLTIAKEVDDLKSAVVFVKSKGYEKIGLFGHSIGALVSLKCYSPEINSMVLWSPITNKVQYKWEEKLTKEQLAELKEKDYYTRTRTNAIRLIYRIDKEMLKEREEVNPEELLKGVRCPILIIQGTEDKSVPVEDSKNAINFLSRESCLEIVEGANHDFKNHVNTMVELTNEWFKKHLI